jgi:hypothetical protein
MAAAVPERSGVPMLEKLTREDFEKCVNRNFHVQHGDHALELELVECRALPSGRRKDATREPFSVIFRGPLHPVLPQQIHAVSGPMETLEIFMVPIGPDQMGMQYEAIFS